MLKVNFNFQNINLLLIQNDSALIITVKTLQVIHNYACQNGLLSRILIIQYNVVPKLPLSIHI